MANWFDFKGIRSSSLGVRVVEYPPITLPSERSTFQEVPGSSGSLTLLEGDDVYDDVVLSVSCYLKDGANVDRIAAWLRGSGNLILGDMPDRYYKARVTNQIEMATLIIQTGYKSFSVIFRCAPYRYIHPQPSPKTLTSSPGSIANPGTAEAYPLITIVGSGDMELTIGDKVLTVSGLASQVTYDTETGFALDGSGNDLTKTVSLNEWPLAILPGTHAVSWTGTVTGVTITRPWRYI